ncbi:unnamed protein product [Caretta caretta]
MHEGAVGKEHVTAGEAGASDRGNYKKQDSWAKKRPAAVKKVCSLYLKGRAVGMWLVASYFPDRDERPCPRVANAGQQSTALSVMPTLQNVLPMVAQCSAVIGNTAANEQGKARIQSLAGRTVRARAWLVAGDITIIYYAYPSGPGWDRTPRCAEC